MARYPICKFTFGRGSQQHTQNFNCTKFQGTHGKETMKVAVVLLTPMISSIACELIHPPVHLFFLVTSLMRFPLRVLYLSPAERAANTASSVLKRKAWRCKRSTFWKKPWKGDLHASTQFMVVADCVIHPPSDAPSTGYTNSFPSTRTSFSTDSSLTSPETTENISKISQVFFTKTASSPESTMYGSLQ